MFIVEGIHKLSTATVLFHNFDFTLQILYPFIIELKKLLQL